MLILEVGGVDEDQLVVLGGKADVLFEDRHLVASVLVQADLSDAEYVVAGQKGGDQREDFGGIDVDRHDSFSGHAPGCFRRLAAELDPQDLLGAADVAASLGERLLAFHHRRIGLLAQLLDHCRRHFRHCQLPALLPTQWIACAAHCRGLIRSFKCSRAPAPLAAHRAPPPCTAASQAQRVMRRRLRH